MSTGLVHIGGGRRRFTSIGQASFTIVFSCCYNVTQTTSKEDRILLTQQVAGQKRFGFRNPNGNRPTSVAVLSDHVTNAFAASLGPLSCHPTKRKETTRHSFFIDTRNYPFYSKAIQNCYKRRKKKK
ncbi:hypothetical protein K0M31_016934 [Melipona bicolor]|uniref:Uncharacterized protein n=1 Tax=Melipona bicolor TaxID=60889 RepID=A0AA40FDS8_9HYME|nr:hypothetical protein K0M31_016934 [Melipona bicolor]